MGSRGPGAQLPDRHHGSAAKASPSGLATNQAGLKGMVTVSGGTRAMDPSGRLATGCRSTFVTTAATNVSTSACENESVSEERVGARFFKALPIFGALGLTVLGVVLFLLGVLKL